MVEGIWRASDIISKNVVEAKSNQNAARTAAGRFSKKLEMVSERLIGAILEAAPRQARLL